MKNKQFSILYNGHPAEVTAVDKDTYLVQVTYKPLAIKQLKNDKGEEYWVEVETGLETYLATTIGELITAQLVM